MNGKKTRSKANRRRLYWVGGIAALLTAALAVAEGAISFVPASSAPVSSVNDWFLLLQQYTFIGLRNLGLMNIFIISLGIPMYFSLYRAHRKADRELAALALIINLLAAAIFLSTNRAFSLFELSRLHAQAGTQAQRGAIEAAGQALLSIGRSHCPGTFLGFVFGDIAGIMMSAVMLRGKVFSRTNAFAGIFGFIFFLIYEVCASFIPAAAEMAMFLAVGGLLFNLIWLVSLGLRLLRLAAET